MRKPTEPFISVRQWNANGNAAFRADLMMGDAICALGYGETQVCALKALLERTTGTGHEATCIRLLREQGIADVEGDRIQWFIGKETAPMP